MSEAVLTEHEAEIVVCEALEGLAWQERRLRLALAALHGEQLPEGWRAGLAWLQQARRLCLRALTGEE